MDSQGTMIMPMSRRQLLQTGLVAGTSIASGTRTTRAAAPSAKHLQTRVISQLPNRYHGWPTLARRSSGELVLVCSGGRESHVCPFGRVELMRSHDEGTTWTWPETILDGPIDDRDAGILETDQGTLLATTFTSLAYEPSLTRLSGEKQQRWQAAHQRISQEQRQRALGVWMIRSTDGGVTWSQRYRCLVNSPHGPQQLANGNLLYAGKQLWQDQARIGVCRSTDDGISWEWLSAIPTRPGDDHAQYHELHAVEAGDRIVVHIRNHNAQNSGETLQTESTDGGNTWSTPHAIGVWGLPSHLTKLRDGRLLMSYGHRRPPFGNQARVSADAGRTWSEPILISADGNGGDLGYPSTVQLQDGSLLTVWYEKLKSSNFAVLRQAHWQLT